MKVESISIQNFKLFDKLEVSFKHKTLEEVSNQFLILGDNGTGKTTLLQAIALPLALATRQIQSIYDFDWLGFLPGRFWKWGNPRIQLEVSFENEEIEATRVVAEKWYEAQSKEFQSEHEFVKPSGNPLTQLILMGNYWKVGENSPAERSQFQGRYYARSLFWSGDTSVRSWFSKLPGIFWFDQFRNLGANTYSEGNGERPKEAKNQVSFESGVGRLREHLIRWKRRQNSGQPDYLKELETLYKSIFLGRSFVGIENMPSFESPTEEEECFVLSDGHRTYDIVEMSAGEQSIIPFLYEVVRRQIAYSVVLIDEVDLNLHPPAAQSLIRHLPSISSTCQFILTTHSEAVSNVINRNETWRLPGGSLCL
ncbi:MAG: AAA family ATPase [Pseudomonadota bacterium]